MLTALERLTQDEWQPAQWRGSADKVLWTQWRPIYTQDDGRPGCGGWTTADWDHSDYIQVRLLVDGEWLTSEVFPWTVS